jgi:hypothetical protein
VYHFVAKKDFSEWTQHFRGLLPIKNKYAMSEFYKTLILGYFLPCIELHRSLKQTAKNLKTISFSF